MAGCPSASSDGYDTRYRHTGRYRIGIIQCIAASAQLFGAVQRDWLSTADADENRMANCHHQNSQLSPSQRRPLSPRPNAPSALTSQSISGALATLEERPCKAWAHRSETQISPGAPVEQSGCNCTCLLYITVLYTVHNTVCTGLYYCVHDPEIGGIAVPDGSGGDEINRWTTSKQTNRSAARQCIGCPASTTLPRGCPASTTTIIAFQPSRTLPPNQNQSQPLEPSTPIVRINQVSNYNNAGSGLARERMTV
jgi:hypothetical protein